MLVLNGDEALVKEVKNSALQIEQSGVAAKQQGDVLGMLRPKLADSMDEMMHSFLREARRKGCARTLGRIKHETRRFEINISNGFQMISSASGSGGPSKGGLVANLGYALLTNGETQLLEYERRRGEPSDYWIRRLKKVLDHFSAAQRDIEAVREIVNKFKQEQDERVEEASKESVTCLLNGVAKKSTETFTEIRQDPELYNHVTEGMNHGNYIPFADGPIIACIILDFFRHAIAKRVRKSIVPLSVALTIAATLTPHRSTPELPTLLRSPGFRLSRRAG